VLVAVDCATEATAEGLWPAGMGMMIDHNAAGAVVAAVAAVGLAQAAPPGRRVAGGGGDGGGEALTRQVLVHGVGHAGAQLGGVHLRVGQERCGVAAALQDCSGGRKARQVVTMPPRGACR
jgi:hypothetical protein